jgi:hypothetical protein
MEKSKAMVIIGWLGFIPLEIIIYMFAMWSIRTIPLFRVIDWLFNIGNNPFETEIVNGPIGFLLILITHGISHVAAVAGSILITSKPILAFRILIGLNIIPIIIAFGIMEIYSNNILDGNLAYHIADLLGLVISFFIVSEGFLRD